MPDAHTSNMVFTSCTLILASGLVGAGLFQALFPRPLETLHSLVDFSSVPSVFAFSFGVAMLAILLVTHCFRAAIYDCLIVDMTAKWYYEVLGDVERGSRVLDVGVGTGTSLIRNKRLLEDRDLTVTGVDYNAQYIAFAKASVRRGALEGRLTMHCASIYDPELGALVGAEEELFDYIYFSGSFSLMPDPLAALQASAKLLKPNGKIYITQTYQKKNFPMLSVLKPLLLYLTTIDFGALTFDSQIRAMLAESGMRVLKHKPIPGSVDNYYQTATIIILQP